MSKKKKSKAHKNLIWYNERKYCTNPKESSAIEKFIEAIYPTLKLKNKDHNTEKKKIALNVIISNAYDNYQSKKFISIPFYREYYKLKKNYGLKYNTYEFIVGGTKALIEDEYLELKPGKFHYQYKEDNTVSGVRATEKLIDDIKKYIVINTTQQNYYEVPEGVTYIFSEDEFSKIEFDCVVELKDKDKNIIEYRPNRESEFSKKFLHEYNPFINSFDVRIASNKIKPNKYKHLGINTTDTTARERDYTINTSIPLIGFCHNNYMFYKKLDCRLKRVFNDSVFNRGGRFYDADYQMLSEEERSWITINGNSTVEIDFKCFHPRILYHEKEIDIKADLYRMVLPEPELRGAIKKMLNIMINCNGDYQAKKAFEEDLDEDEDGEQIKEAMIKHKISSWDLIKAIRKVHKPIEDYFGSNDGKNKQYKDSIIAMRIMKYFMKKKIACLCVHDSFIVEEKCCDELYQVMIVEYKKMFKYEPELEINERKNNK
ncbi:MAG: hypothetical protein D8M26_13615 [Ignavibacteriae bacterium]|nr:hypothetical protein [Ignavibacteriota bacterium]MCE7855113.1 hypothetical protein [Ignavibacteria bacterium CHB3]